MVPLSTDLQKNFQNLGQSPGGPLRLSNPRSSRFGSRCPEHPMGKPGCIRFSSHCPSNQGDTKLQSQICRIILIAPGWPTKPWFWDLVEMSLDIPRELPPICTLLKQPLNNHYHTNPTSLNLHTWYLGVQLSKNTGSMQMWQKVLLLLKDSQQRPSILPSGETSKDGAQRNRWTSGLLL